MGFFLRKALRAGPLRFNLSKGGVGVSAGITGLRLGMGPRGAYVAGGRHGFYFREYGGSGRRARGAAPPLEVEAVPPQAEPAKPARPKLFWLLAPGLVLVVLGMASETPGLAILGAVWAGVGVVLAVQRARYTKRLSEYLELLTGIPSTPDTSLLGSIQRARTRAGLRREHLQAAHERAFKDAVIQWASERLADQDAPRWLGKVAEALELSDEDRARLALEAFKELVWATLADHRFTSEEEEALRTVREGLGIRESDIAEELRALEEFRRARDVEEGRLPEVEAGINLSKGERCHYRTHGALLEARKTGLTPVKEGAVYVTSKRLLVVGDGTTSIPHGKVLDVEVDYDSKLVTITKDGRQTPLHLSVSEPILVGRLIETLAQGE